MLCEFSTWTSVICAVWGFLLSVTGIIEGMSRMLWQVSLLQFAIMCYIFVPFLTDTCDRCLINLPQFFNPWKSILCNPGQNMSASCSLLINGLRCPDMFLHGRAFISFVLFLYFTG